MIAPLRKWKPDIVFRVVFGTGYVGLGGTGDSHYSYVDLLSDAHIADEAQPVTRALILAELHP